jgi:hypothetical protein
MAGAAPDTGQLNAVPMLAAVVGTAFKINHFIKVCTYWKILFNNL